jgi:hypothetical protein
MLEKEEILFLLGKITASELRANEPVQIAFYFE